MIADITVALVSNIDLPIRNSRDVQREGRQYAAPMTAEVAAIIPGDGLRICFEAAKSYISCVVFPQTWIHASIFYRLGSVMSFGGPSAESEAKREAVVKEEGISFSYILAIGRQSMRMNGNQVKQDTTLKEERRMK